jgi:hypothetical protein
MGAIQTRDRPGDRRYKQVHRNTRDTLRKADVGGQKEQPCYFTASLDCVP